MKKGKKRQAVVLKILRVLFVLSCLGGFLYQTFQFLFLYWTYPTVVDIQQIEPTYLEMPSFTICNSLGYNFTHMCRGFNVSLCLPSALTRFAAKKFCKRFPEICFDGDIPGEIQPITFSKLMNEVELTSEDHKKLRVNLEDYMQCKIEFAGEESKCDLESIMGPLYSKEDLPQYCFAIYSKWGQPNKKKALIPKGATMHFHFVLNSTQREDPEDPDEDSMPAYNLPSNPSVQIAVHSPYTLPSPYEDGMSYIGGKAYELRLKMNERHLLPSPYQTNCTDYMKNWEARGGRGPVNQMGVVQECRMNRTYKALGCVPVTLSYPHNHKLCKVCDPEPCNFSTFAKECGKLADSYTQPCDSITYTSTRDDKIITTYELIDSSFLNIEEVVRRRILEYDCEGTKIWKRECATIDVYVLFDRFEITNLTYNPKFESLELFSVIGGYMGMWLGISLLNVYDFAGTIIVMIKSYAKKRKRRMPRTEKFPGNYERNSNYQTDFYGRKNGYRRPLRNEVW
nr:amiloride-sensitive cation channel [Cupiennius salei]